MNFTVTFSEIPTEFHVSFSDRPVVSGDVFAGPYSVTPSLARQTLLTVNKSMTGNVTVAEIPYFEVTNQERGRTAIIGGI